MYGEATSGVGEPPDLQGKPASPKNPAPGSPATATASAREARTPPEVTASIEQRIRARANLVEAAMITDETETEAAD